MLFPTTLAWRIFNLDKCSSHYTYVHRNAAKSPCSILHSFNILTKTRMGKQTLMNSQMSNCMKISSPVCKLCRQTNAVQLTHVCNVHYQCNKKNPLPEQVWSTTCNEFHRTLLSQKDTWRFLMWSYQVRGSIADWHVLPQSHWNVTNMNEHTSNKLTR